MKLLLTILHTATYAYICLYNHITLFYVDSIKLYWKCVSTSFEANLPPPTRREICL